MTLNLPNGAWSVPSLFDPNESEYMVIDPEASRVVTFFVMSIHPVQRTAMRNWYEQVEPGFIRSRLSPANAGSLIPSTIDGANFHWIKWKEQTPWTWVPPQNIPEWIPGKVLKAYAKMDLRQKPEETPGALGKI